MTVRPSFIFALSSFTLAVFCAAGSLAQGTADQPDDRERHEVLESQSGHDTDTPARDSHSSATNCTDLLAEESRMAAESARDELNRRSTSVGQATQGSDAIQSEGISGNSANEVATTRPQGSRDQMSQGNTTPTLEDCHNQQDAIRNGEPTGSGQGAIQTAPRAPN